MCRVGGEGFVTCAEKQGLVRGYLTKKKGAAWHAGVRADSGIIQVVGGGVFPAEAVFATKIYTYPAPDDLICTSYSAYFLH